MLGLKIWNGARLYKFIFFTIGALFCASSFAESYFRVIPLGVSGGELEDNLSAYLIGKSGSDDFIALDAGTLCSAIKKIPVSKLGMPADIFLKQHVKGYLISHAHLDHISGLVICSPIDSAKPIFGIDSTIDYLKENVFNWKIWPNLADQGYSPRINQYHYQSLTLGKETALPNGMAVKAFPLSHGNGYPSTAFLLNSSGHYILYFGDTGADQLEKTNDIQKIWQTIAPLIRNHQLNTIFIECSYINARPNNLLFGHLNPYWLLLELNQLAKIVDPKNPATALKSLNIVVTHIKQGLEAENIPEMIFNELNSNNHLGITFIIPKPLQALNL